MGYNGNMKILLPWGVPIHRIFYSVYDDLDTFHGDIHPPELNGPHNLSLHVSIAVHEHGGEVPVWVVRDACCGDALQELCGWEFSSQPRKVLIQQCTQWDPNGGRSEVKTYLAWVYSTTWHTP